MPKFRFQDDIEERQVSDNLPLAIEQMALNKQIAKQLDLELRTNVDVCDLLKMMRTCRDFAAKTGCTDDDNLYDYLTEFRLYPQEEWKTLKQIHLRHVDSLIQCLELSRVKRMISHKNDPFHLTPSRFRIDLNLSVQNLKETAGPDDVLLRLYRFIEENLNKEETIHNPIAVNPSHGLKEYIKTFLEDHNIFSNEKVINEQVLKAIDKKVKNENILTYFHKIVTTFS